MQADGKRFFANLIGLNEGFEMDTTLIVVVPAVLVELQVHTSVIDVPAVLVP